MEVRKEVRRFPEVAKPVRDPVGIPRQQERDERRVSESGRDRSSGAGNQWIGGSDRHRRKKRHDPCDLARPAKLKTQNLKLKTQATHRLKTLCSGTGF